MKRSFITLAALLLSLSACAQKAPKVIQLLEPTYDEGLTLMQALKERKSSSGFTEKEIPLQDLSNILWAAVGVNRPDGKRTAPTGSNRQEIEVYAFFKTGAYYYNYENHTLELVKQYMNIWFMGCITCGLNMEGNKWLIGAGHPRLSSAMTVMGMLINTVLDPLMIFGGEACHAHMLAHSWSGLHGAIDLLMPMVHWIKASGIAGAALATVLSQVVASAVIIVILRRTRLLSLRPLPFREGREAAATIVRYAIPAVLGMLLFPISNYVTTWITGKFGDAAVAGMSAAQKLEGVAFVFPMAFGTTLMPIIAQNYGARLYSRVRTAFKFAVSVAFGFLSVAAVLLFFFGHLIVPFITKEHSVQVVMIQYMRIIPFGFAMLEITRFGGFTLVGCGHPMMDTALKTVRIAGIMIPLYMVVYFTRWMPGIYYARLLTDISGGLLLFSAAWIMIHRLPEDGLEERTKKEA